MLSVFLITIIIWGVLYIRFPESPWTLIYYTIIFPVVNIFFLIVKRTDRCPNCKRNWAMEEVNRTVIDVVERDKNVKKRGYDSLTGRTEYYYDKVPTYVRKYEVVKRCKYCKYQIVKSEEELPEDEY